VSSHSIVFPNSRLILGNISAGRHIARTANRTLLHNHRNNVFFTSLPPALSNRLPPAAWPRTFRSAVTFKRRRGYFGFTSRPDFIRSVKDDRSNAFRSITVGVSAPGIRYSIEDELDAIGDTESVKHAKQIVFDRVLP
jgi:hypothetical protein